MIIAKRLIIHGSVQGVGYRYCMRQVAQRLRLNGWVRNRHDGTVEALVQGPRLAVDQAIKWAAQGPAGALVSHVDVISEDATEAHVDFYQLPTL